MTPSKILQLNAPIAAMRLITSRGRGAPYTISPAIARGSPLELASSYRSGSCRSACDIALASGAGEPVLAESAGRLAAAIKARDDLPVHVNDLAGGIDAQAGARVVDNRGCPGCKEGWFLDPMPWGRLVEIRIDSAFHKGIVKYPANPPSVGDPATIGMRTALYFSMIAISLAVMIAAAMLRLRLLVRHGPWNAFLIAAGAYLIVVVVAGWVLPPINELPAGFPAVVLWQFRIASLGAQVTMWTTLGLVFGTLTDALPRQSGRG